MIFFSLGRLVRFVDDSGFELYYLYSCSKVLVLVQVFFAFGGRDQIDLEAF